MLTSELHRPLRDRLDIRGSPLSWAALIGQLRASFFSSTALAPAPRSFTGRRIAILPHRLARSAKISIELGKKDVFGRIGK